MFNILSSSLNFVGLYFGSGAIILVILLLAIFFDKQKFTFNTRCITLAGISVALSFVLSLVKIFKLSSETGSVTACQLLPIFIFGFIYGVRKGVFVGLIVGILNFVASPYFIHPCQLLLDYLLAYTVTGACGFLLRFPFFDKHFKIGSGIGCCFVVILRFISLTFSGIFAYESPLLASMSINCVALVDGLIAIVVFLIIISVKPVYNQMAKLKQF